MPVIGLSDVTAALAAIQARAEAAAVTIVQRGSAIVEAEAKKQFTQAHTRDTRTPSRPGEPPAVITGTLRRSIAADPVRLDGTVAKGAVYPTAVYSRIQELGGITGRGHHTRLPARPYMQPARKHAEDQLEVVAVTEWGLALRT